MPRVSSASAPSIVRPARRLEHPHACRGELERERKTVKAPAHVMDVGRAAAVQAEVRVVRHGSIQEQRDRRIALVPG